MMTYFYAHTFIYLFFHNHVLTLWHEQHHKKTNRNSPEILFTNAWWRHQMETFSVLLAICAGNSPVTIEFPAQRPVMQSFDVFFDLRLNKRLSKQSWGWRFEMLSYPLWLHCNGFFTLHSDIMELPSTAIQILIFILLYHMSIIMKKMSEAECFVYLFIY